MIGAVDVIRTKCSRYMRRGKPSRLAARLHDTDFSIMTQYQAEYRGLVQYYLLAFNVHRLWRFHRVMELVDLPELQTLDSLAEAICEEHGIPDATSAVTQMVRFTREALLRTEVPLDSGEREVPFVVHAPQRALSRPRPCCARPGLSTIKGDGSAARPTWCRPGTWWTAGRTRAGRWTC